MYNKISKFILVIIISIGCSANTSDKKDLAARKYYLKKGANFSINKKSKNFVQLSFDKKIKNEDLKYLKDIKKLGYLSLEDMNITDKSMFIINKLELISLNLSNTKITDKGLKEISKIKTLKILYLANTNITDTGIEAISKLKLGILDLKNTKITDKSLKAIENMKDFVMLSLINTGITDKGLIYLEGMKNLYDLGLKGTKVTKEGVKKLKKKISTCLIYY